MGDVRYVVMTDAAGRRETGTLVGLHQPGVDRDLRL